MIGFRYDWDDHGQTVIRVYIGDMWDWDDLEQAVYGLQTMITSVEHQVDVITIMRSSTTPPDGDLTTALQAVIQVMPRNTGVLTMVGGNAAVNFAFKRLAATLPIFMGRFHQTDHLSDAYLFIAYNRPEASEDPGLVA